jgi:hypothetical protein
MPRGNGQVSYTRMRWTASPGSMNALTRYAGYQHILLIEKDNLYSRKYLLIAARNPVE